MDMDEAATNSDLRKKIRYLKNVLRDVPGCVYWKDKNGAYLGCNQVFLSMVGMQSEEELIGKQDSELCWKAQASMLRHHDNLVMSDKETKTLEETVMLSNGEKRLHSVVKSPLHDEHNRIIGVVGTSIDITYRQALETQLRDSRTREERFKTLSAIGGMLAHELRTPLASLKLMADSVAELFPKLLRGYNLANHMGNIKDPIRGDILTSLNDYAKNIEQAVSYMQTTIATILAGMHYATSAKPTKPEPIFIRQVVEYALKEYPLQTQQQALIHTNIAEDLQGIGEQQTLTHVLHNLLKNALHTIKKCGKGHISITATAKQSNIELVFKDTAQGIQAEHLPHIFEPFYTTKNKTTQSVGLGLYFCRIALERINNHIECDSHWGKYTAFKIILPSTLHNEEKIP